MHAGDGHQVGNARGVEHLPLARGDLAGHTHRKRRQQRGGGRIGNPVSDAPCQPGAHRIDAAARLPETVIEGAFHQAGLGGNVITQQQALCTRIARRVVAQRVLPQLAGRGTGHVGGQAHAPSLLRPVGVLRKADVGVELPA